MTPRAKPKAPESVRGYRLEPCPLCAEAASYNKTVRRAWCHNGGCHLGGVLLTRAEWCRLGTGRRLLRAAAGKREAKR
jgi:hypothetical protein